MSNFESRINEIVRMVETLVEEMHKEATKDKPKPTVYDQFKASAMAEIARRIRARAIKIEEDWMHFTRE